MARPFPSRRYHENKEVYFMKRKLLSGLSVSFILLPFISGFMLCSLFTNTKEITAAFNPTEKFMADTPVGIQIVREGGLILKPMPDKKQLDACQHNDDSTSWIL